MKKLSKNTRLSRCFGSTLGALAATVLIAACASQPSTPLRTSTPAISGSPLVCENPQQYAGRPVGDGHCVSLIKRCSGAPDTRFWRPGPKVLDSQLPLGTIIATFDGAHYPSKHGHHAAIYIRHDQHGIWVWDQWLGKPVHQRLIKTRNDNADPGNTAQAYRVVQWP